MGIYNLFDKNKFQWTLGQTKKYVRFPVALLFEIGSVGRLLIFFFIFF